MDPITSFSLASSVLQFVLFAKDLTKGVIEVRERGSLKEIRSLSDVNQSLQGWSAQLHSHLEEAQADPDAQAEPQLAACLKGCIAVAKTLDQSLAKVQSQSKDPNLRESIKIWLRSARSAPKLQQLQKQLDIYRSEISVSLAALAYSQSLQVKEETEKVTAADVPAKPVQIKYRPRIRWPSTALPERLPIYQGAHDDPDHVTDEESWPRVLEILKDTEPEVAFQIERAVLSDLEFPEMSRRLEAVEPAHAKTFRWVFERPEDLQADFASFSDWLLSDQALYWVTGKAGSGKSTLMKLLLDDSRTKSIMGRQMCNNWLICSYFFWNAGTGMQVSQEGLIRTLLYQCLSKERQLIGHIVPRRWDLERLFGKDEEPWDWTDCVRALHSFFDLTAESHSILILIDGLDEFVGDHTALTSLVQTFSRWQHVKVCVSSRPWMVFEDEYKQKPSLRMENLTRPDIELFVADNLRRSPGFLDLQLAEPEYAAQLISKVRQRASGVFLWVVLVTKDLLRGLRDGETLRDLEERLLSLPVELEALFHKMLCFDDMQQLQKASRMIQLVQLPKLLNISQDCRLIDIAFADEETSDMSALLRRGNLPESRLSGIARRTYRRIDAACRGLIEAHPPGQVGVYDRLDFLHRTVKDYLERDDIKKKILEATPKDFNPAASWSQAFIVRLRNLDVLSPEKELHVPCFLIKQAELTGYRSCDSLCEALDEALDEAMKSRPSSTHRVTPNKAAMHKLLLVSATANQLATYVNNNLETRTYVPREDLKELWQKALRPRVGSPNPERVFKIETFHTCRAEMAEVLLRHGADPTWTVSTKNTRTVWGVKDVDAAHAETMEAMLKDFQASGIPGRACAQVSETAQ